MADGGEADYEKGELVESEIAHDPFSQFAGWYETARNSGAREPSTMTLATVDAQGKPSARIVLMRAWDARGFVFYTNYDSRKGRELDENAHAALLFFWEGLERQIRLEGSVERVGHDESDAYFGSRPRGHRLGAWASPQSRTILDRSVLEMQMQAAETRFPNDVPRPPYWGGYRFVPQRFEFWQGRKNRLHDRIVYRREGEHWHVERLAP